MRARCAAVGHEQPLGRDLFTVLETQAHIATIIQMRIETMIGEISRDEITAPSPWRRKDARCNTSTAECVHWEVKHVQVKTIPMAVLSARTQQRDQRPNFIYEALIPCLSGKSSKESGCTSECFISACDEPPRNGAFHWAARNRKPSSTDVVVTLCRFNADVR